MTRRSMVSRVVALEDGGSGQWHFTLENGRRITVSIDVVLEVFMGGIEAVYGEMEGGPPLDLAPEIAKGLRLLAQVDSTTETSALGGSVVSVAKEWRERAESSHERPKLLPTRTKLPTTIHCQVRIRPMNSTHRKEPSS